MLNEMKAQIEKGSREILSDSYSMSIGEVISLYRDSEIEIHPEFQRVFRWTTKQKSALIESIFLHIPIPPIFVAQRDDGVWDVIDGVQRLSTILQFVGIYVDENGRAGDHLTLEAGEYLPAMQGARWSAEKTGQGFVIDPTLQRDFKRSKLDFRIIRKESDADAKYDLFQRLNSGTNLTEQEARNCLILMLNRQMFADVDRMSRFAEFRSVAAISDRKESESFRSELVLRFFAQQDYSETGESLRTQFGDYLTEWMRSAAPSWTQGRDARISLFEAVFDLLARVGGDDVFRRWDGNRRVGPFSTAAFEFVTSGIARNIDYWLEFEELLDKRLKSFWNEPIYHAEVGAGVSARTRFPRLVLNGRKYFECE